MSQKMILKATLFLVIVGLFDFASSQLLPSYGASRGQQAFTQRTAAPLPPQPQPTAYAGGQLLSSTASPNAYARILRQEQDNQFDGTFNFGFETENGISQQARGYLENPGTPEEAQTVQGSYSYTSPEGRVITVNWIAGRDGFRAESDAIPTAPPVPEAIARALEYIRSLPPQPEDKNN